MRAGGAPLAILLLLFTFCAHQVTSGDLYWEGEEDGSNEFLEVKDTDTLAGSALRRLKRLDFPDPFGWFGGSSTSTQSPDSDFGSVTEDQLPDEENGFDKDEDRDNDGSGLPGRERESEPKEKTLRVTFVVIQPYHSEYSNRDSKQFQTFSKSLADAVNELFDTLPGTQRASLVRIQSRILDNFSCKVTLDIVTTGYDDTDHIKEMLVDHIRQRRMLGSVAVSLDEFNATVIDPGYNLAPDCAADQFKCDGRCVPAAYRCNGLKECFDGTDEENCPSDNWNRNLNPPTTTAANREQEPETLAPTLPSFWSPWRTDDRGGSADETHSQNGIDSEFTTPSDIYETVCPSDSIRCDQTRCVLMNKRCDGQRDCEDGVDEAGCEYCGLGDFRCNNGKCIEGSHRCNRIVDCPTQEDEENCDCREDEFRCVSNGVCIESRKRCDNISNCRDNSDEENCTCSLDQWQCDHGSCIKRSKRCDGRVDCPSDRSDERNCYVSGYFRCASGKLIPESRRCNRRYDCPSGDYSDEHNCPCGDGDFKCDNGYCIPEYKHCDRTHDCQDGSDERHCTYGVVCMASQYKCSSGQCVQADSYCNGTVECVDGSDESNCPCRDEFKCPDGTCISLALRCDGVKHCRPDGTDEKNCDAVPLPCPAGSFTCPPGSRNSCGRACDGQEDCDGGEDEQNCDSDDECTQRCDGRCLDDQLICNGSPDCSDGSDEQNCDNCDRPNDFRCKNGECLNEAQRCNGIPECSDYSDERDCNITVPHEKGCEETEFQCRDGTCINKAFQCDERADCNDSSDEENCTWFARSTRSTAPTQPCRDSEFTCYDGRCIPHARRCDNFYDCSDFSDEQNCYNSGPAETCDYYSWRCSSGQCIEARQHCDGFPDCDDSSDELDCPTVQPFWPTTTAYTPLPTPSQRPYRPTFPPITYQPNYPQPTTIPPIITPFPSRPGVENQDICNRNEWRCENGPCINKALRCDGHVDCVYDSSDEFDCPPDSPVALNLKTYPDAQAVRNGGDVVFQCRDEGPQRAPVRWVREGGRPLKPGSSDKHGRLEMNRVSLSDSGVYICQAPRFLGYPGGEVRVELIVEKSPVTHAPPFAVCLPYQATCGNGECISKSAVCDGKADCTDGSDEETCNHNGMCEPNQYQCRNRKCVLKTWLCDSEDDCGDGSDEENCGVKDPRQLCLPIEFKCARSDQCIPKSFHCDGQSDCVDGSDEIGCAPVHVTKPPQPSNIRLNPGDTLTLVCEAVGVPTPLISWRLNWGHVPSKCTSTSQDGVGTLTCPNIQPEDSGAYSCEAINNKGTTFAAPDSIVYVNRTQICPTGFFNSDARSESECIRCFCFGESSQCHSADLFIYNMPTPLGEGGTRLMGVTIGYNGEATLDSQPITDQYYYQPLRNGAAVTKLENFGSDWSYGSSAHPYLTLPETYNNNQLTSYGGHIKYRIIPHSPRYGSDDSMPTIIIKGKYQSLVHYSRGDKSREAYIEARLTPDSWQKAGPSGLVPATREDIMMALDKVEMILLRADLNNAGVNITDFALESAQHIDVGLGAANLVEECTCPPGYEGLSCQKCASGYTRVSSGPWLGNCVREQKPCPPGTYGDLYSGCLPCPCPLTNPENQFARTCSLGPSGRVICDCQQGYAGETCEYCDENYMGNPLIAGGWCERKQDNKCSSVGTLRELPLDECQCKDQVQGRYCDQCKNESFYLSPDFRHGCALCFCSGVSHQCTSSSLRRKTTYVRFNTPQIVDQVKVYSSASLGPDYSMKYNAPVETSLRPALTRNAIALNEVDGATPVIYYWSLPQSFSGDKVTSYGGYLQYTLRFVPSKNTWNRAADVQLINENHLTFHYFGDFNPTSDGFLNGTVQFLEKGWHRSDGKEISREHFLLALADVKAVLVKATYAPNTQPASIESASIETAEPGGDGPQALHVEQCVCPTGYIGTSCEDCAPGYTRSSSGLYLEHCAPCNCSGHSNMCHPETGVCFECRDNTAGENCELCRDGYVRNENKMCVPFYGSNTTPGSGVSCGCDARGEASPCISGFCDCKQNVEGEYCDRCRPGTFGLDSDNPLGCLSCYCSGVTSECHEASHYSRIPMAAPIFGDNYGGYSLTDLQGDRTVSDQFVPAPNESELRYVFPFPPDGELYWSLPEFPGNRVKSYGGKLLLTQVFTSPNYGAESVPGTDVVLYGDDIAVYWSNPSRFISNEELSYQVPLQEDGWFVLNTANPARRSDFMSVLKNLRRVLVRATLVPNILSTAIADVSMDTATENYDPSSPAAKGVEICMCPEGYSGTSCETCIQGYYRDQYDRCSRCNCNGHSCQLGRYNEVVCNCLPPYTGLDCSTLEGSSATTEKPAERPQLPETTVFVRITSPTLKIQEVGKSVNFTCMAQSRITPGHLPVTWTKKNGYLPTGRSQVDARTGTLIITNVQFSDSGTYVCQTHDGYSTGQAVATLKVDDNNQSIPSVTIEPAVNEYFEGDTINLRCLATGNPLPSITWQRSLNRPLPRSAEIYESSFVIQNVKEEDSGEYRCIASNAAGSTDNIAIVTVRRKPIWPTNKDDKLTVSPASSTINEGSSTRLVCTGTANVPAGSIDWFRQDRTPLLSNVRSDNGVLYIDIARPENQGIYVCQSASSDAPPVPVLVTITPLVTPPKTSNIEVNVERVKIPTGGSSTVDCNPTGYPLPTIKWSKPQGEFGPGTSQRDNSLIIYNAQDSDEGYYLCEGLVDGVPIKSIYISIEIERREPPKVEIWPPGEQAVTLGNPFELHCQVVQGVPDPDITWSGAGGRPLGSHAEIQPYNVLKFESIEVNDEGEYSCSATNVAGSDTASVIVKVRSPPEITITPSEFIEVQKGDPINIECRASGYPEPMVSIKSNEQREVVPPARGMAVMRVPAATEQYEGSYLCSASSPAGILESPFEIRVNLIGDGGFPNQDGNPDSNEPSSLTAFEGGDPVLLCDVAEGNQVKWDRGGYRPLQTNAIQDGTSLRIYKATKYDSGDYECKVVDTYTNEIRQVATVRLQVVAAPRITLQPKTQTVHPGNSPTVRCIVEGDDIEMITWRAVNRRMSSRVEIRNESLIFHQIEVEDAGEYECLAMTRYANTSAVAEVIVSEADRDPLESHDNEQWAHAGAAVHLSCNVSRPGLRIRWTKNGRAVPRSVRQKHDGSLFIKLAQKSDSGRYVCLIEDEYGRQTSNYINLHIEGPGEPTEALVTIDQPRNRFRVGENVDILCRPLSRAVSVNWERYGNNQQRQYVETTTYGDGTMLYIRGVEQSDAGLYRCTGTDPYGHSSYADFSLEVLPANTGNPQDAVYTAKLGDMVDLPCKHNLEQPVQIVWRREYTPLPSELRSDESNLHLERVTEEDAGTYVCRVMNARADVEARAILRVSGVVPQFGGNSWLSLPSLKDVYKQFDIEISFKPKEENGLILYNSQNQGRTGKYVALQLVDGIPEFLLETGSGPMSVKGDRPLQLNTWHTIRITRTNTKVTMDVDNTGPFTKETPGSFGLLELYQPLYIGGVPDHDQLPQELAGAPGFMGCVSLLIVGREEKNIMLDSLEKHYVTDCDSCSPNVCHNNGVCQEARNERGYTCLCTADFAGLNCERRGEACRPGLCGTGKCSNTVDGYKCACPVTFTGNNCEIKQSIEYPAFTGSTYLAIKAPMTSRVFKMSMKVKATAPVTDGIIMYCAESARGYGGFISLAVRDGRLEFRYNLGDDWPPVVLTAKRTLPANEWTNIDISRVGGVVSLRINSGTPLEENLVLPRTELHLETPMFVGGVDDSIVLNNNTAVSGGFNGCIKDVTVYGDHVDIVNAAILSANVQECTNNNGRGDIPDIPETDIFSCNGCSNGGYCISPEATTCFCQPGYTGVYCERTLAFQSPRRPTGNPCAATPCRNGGTCKPDSSSSLNYACECPLNYAGINCQMPLRLQKSVAFNGTGYLELPAELLRYENLRSEPVVIALAFHTTSDGVLIYQQEASAPVSYGDYMLLRVDQGIVVFDWDLGSGTSTLSFENIFVNDGNRHAAVIHIYANNTVLLSVDGQTRQSMTNGLTSRMNADSSIYIGGIPDKWNTHRYPGFTGCIEQVELMDTGRGLDLGAVALSGRNTQRCRDARSYT